MTEPENEMRYAILVLWMLLGSTTSAQAQLSVGIYVPGVSIGINLPLYPQLVRVPDYPVYYAPGLDSNFFFYDGMYWVYQSDNWYTSDWYNGPWGMVGPEFVPVFVLRIPVRYYQNPPVYFGGWRPDAPPRWGEHWGNDWERRHGNWDRWNRASAPAIAPLPVYQRQYTGERYPRVEQQQQLRTQNYAYRPREAVARQQYEARPGSERTVRPAEAQRYSPQPPQQRREDIAEPRARAPRQGGEEARQPSPPRERAQPEAAEPRRQPQQRGAEPEQRAPRPGPNNPPQARQPSQEQEQEQRRGQGQDRERGKGEDRGQPGRN